MSWISGACEPAPEPESGLHADDLPLYLVERAVLTALKHMEEAEVTLVDCAGALPATKTEQAVLEARAGALAEELRTMRDYIARLVGRERAMRDDGRADDGPGPCASAGLYGDETAVSRGIALGVAPGDGDAVAGRGEVEPEEPLVSRQDLMSMMRSWPGMRACLGMQTWAALHGVGGAGTGEPGGSTRSGGYPAGKLRAYGFGPVPGVAGGAG